MTQVNDSQNVIALFPYLHLIHASASHYINDTNKKTHHEQIQSLSDNIIQPIRNPGSTRSNNVRQHMLFNAKLALIQGPPHAKEGNVFVAWKCS